jgi:hypothetical protein
VRPAIRRRWKIGIPTLKENVKIKAFLANNYLTVITVGAINPIPKLLEDKQHCWIETVQMEHCLFLNEGPVKHEWTNWRGFSKTWTRARADLLQVVSRKGWHYQLVQAPKDLTTKYWRDLRCLEWIPAKGRQSNYSFMFDFQPFQIYMLLDSWFYTI